MFNELKCEEYYPLIDNHKKFADFNTLGLYRSLTENENLNTEQKILLREYANTYFQKTFDFLQVKDPWTYAKVISIGLEMTKGDEENLWRIIRENQYKILSDKRIKHQNFGVYSKHICGYDTCPLDGLMIKQGSYFAEYEMCLGNHNKYPRKVKSEKRKADRKNESKIIDQEISLEE
jgi:hypothetical protein